MKRMHFALIGPGKMGTRWAGVMMRNKNVFFDIVVNKTLDKQTKAQFPEARCLTLTDALNDKTIDAVLIATPHGTLASITYKALKAGKHVLCEKPGALKLNELVRNIRLAKKNDLTYMVGYNHRFHDGFLKARRMIERGKIGEIVFIRARYGFGGRKDYDKEWRLNRKLGGSGELIDQGVHMIDLALSFIGVPNKVRGFTSDTFWKQGNKNIGEDNAFVLLRGRNKKLASIHVSLTQWKAMHNFEIYGTEGYLSIEGLGQRYGGNEKGDEQLVFCKRRKDFESRNVKEQIIKCNPIADDSLKLMLREFLSAVNEGRQPVPSAVDAFNTLRVVEEVYKQQ